MLYPVIGKMIKQSDLTLAEKEELTSYILSNYSDRCAVTPEKAVMLTHLFTRAGLGYNTDELINNIILHRGTAEHLTTMLASSELLKYVWPETVAEVIATSIEAWRVDRVREIAMTFNDDRFGELYLHLVKRGVDVLSRSNNDFDQRMQRMIDDPQYTSIVSIYKLLPLDPTKISTDIQLISYASTQPDNLYIYVYIPATKYAVYSSVNTCSEEVYYVDFRDDLIDRKYTNFTVIKTDGTVIQL